MPIPSYPEWFQVHVAPAGTDRSSVSVFDNASSSNTLDNNTAIASSSSSETKTPSKNTSDNDIAVAASSSSYKIKASSSSSNTSEDNIVIT